MELDIIIINASHFTSKKDGNIYNTINFILVNKDGYIDTEKFKGYSVSMTFVKKNELKNLPILENIKGVFDEEQRGLHKNLVLRSIKTKDGKVIDLV